MIYVIEVKYKDDKKFHPLMKDVHQPEATCNMEECKMQVWTMNDPRNKNYPGEYRMARYFSEEEVGQPIGFQDEPDRSFHPDSLAPDKIEPLEPGEVVSCGEGQGDSTPEIMPGNGTEESLPEEPDDASPCDSGGPVQGHVADKEGWLGAAGAGRVGEAQYDGDQRKGDEGDVSSPA